MKKLLLLVSFVEVCQAGYNLLEGSDRYKFARKWAVWNQKISEKCPGVNVKDLQKILDQVDLDQSLAKEKGEAIVIYKGLLSYDVFVQIIYKNDKLLLKKCIVINNDNKEDVEKLKQYYKQYSSELIVTEKRC